MRECSICGKTIHPRQKEILYGSYEVCKACDEETDKHLKEMEEGSRFRCAMDTDTDWLEIEDEYCYTEDQPVLIFRIVTDGKSLNRSDVWLTKGEVTRLRDALNVFIGEIS